MTYPRQSYPDNYYYPGQFPIPNIDRAELAARLGSMASMRRGGKVVYSDACDSLARWKSNTGVTINNADVFSGTGALKFTPTVGSPFVATVTRTFPLLTYSSMGLEFALKFEARVTSFQWDINYIYGSGPSHLYYRLYYDVVNKKIYYWRFEDIYVELWAINAEPDYWYNFKTVVVPTTGYIKRVMVNDRIYDCNVSAGSGIAQPSQITDPKTCRMEIIFSAYDTGGTQGLANLGLYVLTVDEY